jgi:hypothetical protein
METGTLVTILALAAGGAAVLWSKFKSRARAAGAASSRRDVLRKRLEDIKKVDEELRKENQGVKDAIDRYNDKYDDSTVTDDSDS